MAPSTVVAIALNTSLYPDEADARRVIAEIAAETGLPTADPVRFGADELWAADPRADARARPVTLSLTHETLHLSLRDPFRIARGRRGGRRQGDDRHRRAPGRPVPGASSGWGRASRTATTARPPRRWPPSCRLLVEAVGEVDPDPRARPRGRCRSRWTCVIRWTRGGQVRDRHRAARPRRQGPRGARSTSCSACRRTLPPTDFTIGIDEPAVVAERAARAAAFPALKIKVGGTADLATLEAVRGVFAGPIRVDANTGWEPDDAAPAAAAPRAARRRAHRTALPGSAARSASMAPGALVAADRRRRELRLRSRTSTGSSVSWTGST